MCKLQGVYNEGVIYVQAAGVHNKGVIYVQGAGGTQQGGYICTSYTRGLYMYRTIENKNLLVLSLQSQPPFV